jgi:hypothetical protein
MISILCKERRRHAELTQSVLGEEAWKHWNTSFSYLVRPFKNQTQSTQTGRAADFSSCKVWQEERLAIELMARACGAMKKASEVAERTANPTLNFDGQRIFSTLLRSRFSYVCNMLRSFEAADVEIFCRVPNPKDDFHVKTYLSVANYYFNARQNVDDLFHISGGDLNWSDQFVDAYKKLKDRKAQVRARVILKYDADDARSVANATSFADKLRQQGCLIKFLPLGETTDKRFGVAAKKVFSIFDNLLSVECIFASEMDTQVVGKHISAKEDVVAQYVNWFEKLWNTSSDILQSPSS